MILTYCAHIRENGNFDYCYDSAMIQPHGDRLSERNKLISWLFLVSNEVRTV
jgi:hypothetical protein